MTRASVQNNLLKGRGTASSKTKTEGVIAVDNGGYNTKIFAESMKEPLSISSQKAFGHNQLRLNTEFPDDTYKVKWKGEYYFFGRLLKESNDHITGYTSTKATDYFTLSLLMAVALYGYDVNKVVTCTPISRYKDNEILAIEDLLLGEHEIEINEEIHKFEIKDVIVAPETSTAYLALEPEGKVRWLDLGSRTVGFATTEREEDGYWMPVELESGTIEKEGLDIRNILRFGEFKKYVENLSMELNRKWDEDDTIIAFGGGALVDELTTELKLKYKNLIVADDPLFLQVRGMLKTGLIAFESDDE